MKTLNMIHAAQVVGGEGEDLAVSTIDMVSDVMAAADESVATLDVVATDVIADATADVADVAAIDA